MRSLTCFPSRNFCVIIAILGLCGGVACFKFFVDNIIDKCIDSWRYKMMSFSTFTHLKSDAIAQMLQSDGKIDLNIKPKEQEMLELTIIHRNRVIELENIEKEILAKQKAALWESENAEAINEQNERVARRGVFGDSVRRF